MKRLTDGGAEQRRKNRTRKCPPKIDELCRLLPLTKNKHIFVHNLVQKLAAEVLKMSIRIRIFWFFESHFPVNGVTEFWIL